MSSSRGTIRPATPHPSDSRTPQSPSRLRARLIILAAYVSVLMALLVADHVCFLGARVIIEARVTREALTVTADGQTLKVKWPVPPDTVTLISGSATRREYQVDGTDNTNNFTESDAELQSLTSGGYYTVLAWMRDNSTYSAWRDIKVIDSRTGHLIASRSFAPAGSEISLSAPSNSIITAALERPEAPAEVEFTIGSVPLASLAFDRNDRMLSLQGIGTPGSEFGSSTVYFPMQSGPFAAEVADTLVRVWLWAWVVLGTVAAMSALFVAIYSAGAQLVAITIQHLSRELAKWRARDRYAVMLRDLERAASKLAARLRDSVGKLDGPTAVAGGLICGSLMFVIYIALAQYHAEPHILDASAYFFQAKIFASGRLSAPIPSDLDAFQGPFMVAWHGRWFSQYAPATSLLLAVGMLLKIPWLVEPILGTLALVGIYRLGCRMFDRWTAVLAVGLGALSPFYSYLAASYLSHTVALVCEVGYLLFLLRFLDSKRSRELAIAAALLAAMFSTRELSAVLVGLTTSAWVVATRWRELISDGVRTMRGLLFACGTLALGLGLYLAYNAAQTGNPLLLPRALFAPSDRYGFGVGVGFYGRHTLAAGLVNLDQLLTTLLIDLYGWPFYLTLALIPIAMLRWDRHAQWDRFNLVVALVLISAQVGYFYHGIFLGPRYLYETLPMLLLLSARGITALPALTTRIYTFARWDLSSQIVSSAGRAATVILVGGLVLCNALFYLPRQMQLYRDFSGLPAYQPIDTVTIYTAHLKNALVLTDDSFVYNYVVWPLNDPDLHGNTIYVFAQTGADQARLHAEFPERTLYALDVDGQGHVTFRRLTT